MKNITIALLAIFFMGITNVNAQTDVITSNEVVNEEVTLENHPKECPFTKNAEGKLVCVKTGKVCDNACKNKAKGTCCKGKTKKCCKGKTKKSSCSKSRKSGFSYGNSNDYSGKKSSCSKKSKKGCCSKKGKNKKSCSKNIKTCGAECTKPCCNAETKITAEDRIKVGIEKGIITEEEGKQRLERMEKE